MSVLYVHVCRQSILVNLQESFERGSRNISRLLPIHDHCNITDHITPVDNFSIVKMEDHYLTRTIKDSICMKVNGAIPK